MSTAAPHYDPPTGDAIALRVARSAAAITLFRAGADWFEARYLGESYWIPPFIEGAPLVDYPRQHPKHGTEDSKVRADGRIMVSNVIGPVWADNKVFGRHNTGVTGVMEGRSANLIAEFMLKRYAKDGLVLLSGDVAEDKRAIEYSRQVTYTAKYAWADSHRKARLIDIQKFRSNPANAGLPDPPPSPLQRQAQDWLDQFAASDNARPYKCKYGCSDWSDPELWARHMVHTHHEQVTAADAPQAASVAADKADAAAEAALRDEAAKLQAVFEEKERELAKREAALLEREAAVQKKPTRANKEEAGKS